MNETCEQEKDGIWPYSNQKNKFYNFSIKNPWNILDKDTMTCFMESNCSKDYYKWKDRKQKSQKNSFLKYFFSFFTSLPYEMMSLKSEETIKRLLWFQVFPWSSFGSLCDIYRSHIERKAARLTTSMVFQLK